MLSLLPHADSFANIESPDSPDLTCRLKFDSRRIAETGSFSVVYRCSTTHDTEVDTMHQNFTQASTNTAWTEVAVKAPFTTTPSSLDANKFGQRVQLEIDIWKNLRHTNIVQFLGTVPGNEFGSDYPCMVSTWMENGTLSSYFKRHGAQLSLHDRIKLIKGLIAGVEYLHSKEIIHGDLHPANILIDADGNPHLTDFGLSQAVSAVSDQCWTACPGAVLWTAPELQYPDLYPKLKFQATLQNDVYSLGSVILYILSGRYPWRNRTEAEVNLKEFKNPPRPIWPIIMPNHVWNFIERCWSPRDPGSRPSAQEVMSFCTNRLEQSLRPNPTSDINVVLFGGLGSGKSSILNLLAEKEIAETSSNIVPYTERPKRYQITIDGVQFQFWDTMGFSLAHVGSASQLLPYEQAYSLLRNIPEGVNLILLCVDKGTISPFLRRLYWLINDFFYGGHAPIAFIITHFDMPEDEWWDRNKRDIADRTGVPVEVIPHACVTTIRSNCDQSKHALKELLRTYATITPPVSLYDLSSRTTGPSNLAIHCQLSDLDARLLLDKFKSITRPFNVIFFGETEDETGSIISLVAGRPVAETRSQAITYARPYKINTGLQQFCIWVPMDVNEAYREQEAHMQPLENTIQLIQGLSGESGIDLLVFFKRLDQLSLKALKRYKLYRKILFKQKLEFPAAIVVTQFDSQDPVEKWWDANSKELIKAIGGNVIGHVCIPPVSSYDPGGSTLDKTLVDTRLLIEAMLDGCVSSSISRLPRKGIMTAVTRRFSTQRKNVTVETLMNKCGFTKEQAERIVKLYNG